jgi:S-adenosylmethionine:tRNA ribosyltransferase-isomerase
VRLWTDAGVDVLTAIERIGHIPLPPYIRREDRPSDRERYQTVYARDRGSVAAPTAGLHFTARRWPTCAPRCRGGEITLHVGYGTFKPVRSDTVEEHSVDAEALTVSPDARMP